MRQLYKNRIAEDIGFSKNGFEAYKNGEKPEILLQTIKDMIPTCKHHIEIKVGNTYKRPLVMFYRKIK